MYTYSSNSNWRDQLTAFNGETITYDASGNPTSYYNGTRWTMEWEQGGNLVSATGGGQIITYRYDHTGLRTMKAVTGTPHYYTYANGKLLRETYSGTTLDFVYDHLGWPYAMRYNGTWYYYILNAQGDVVYMVDGSGNQVAYYNYDPFGKIIAIEGSVAHINPLRYRGYYYDTETGFYYLQNRYYDPAICRFINADAMVYTGQGMLGCNMYAYCRNNPVNGYDPCGTCFHRWDYWNDCEKCENNVLNLTGSMGMAGGITIGPWGFFGQFNVCTDAKGNSELQFSYSTPLSTATPSAAQMLDTIGTSTNSIGISFLINASVSNAPSVDKLRGEGYQLGVSCYGASVDMNFIPDTEQNTTYHGLTYSLGVATPDAHFSSSYTIPVSTVPINAEAYFSYIRDSMWGVY